MIKNTLNLENVPIDTSLATFAEYVSSFPNIRNQKENKLQIITYWLFYHFEETITEIDLLGSFIFSLVNTDTPYEVAQEKIFEFLYGNKWKVQFS